MSTHAAPTTIAITTGGGGGGARPVVAPFWASRKRKERDGFDALPSPRRLQVTTKAEPRVEPQPQPKNNLVLAGYLAHKFLTRGTLLGQRLDSAAAASPASFPSSARRVGGNIRAQEKQPAKELQPPPPPKPMAYADVAWLLKGESGAHIPGIVNPTQLGRWLQM